MNRLRLSQTTLFFWWVDNGRVTSFLAKKFVVQKFLPILESRPALLVKVSKMG